MNFSWVFFKKCSGALIKWFNPAVGLVYNCFKSPRDLSANLSFPLSPHSLSWPGHWRHAPVPAELPCRRGQWTTRSALSPPAPSPSTFLSFALFPGPDSAFLTHSRADADRRRNPPHHGRPEPPLVGRRRPPTSPPPPPPPDAWNRPGAGRTDVGVFNTARTGRARSSSRSSPSALPHRRRPHHRAQGEFPIRFGSFPPPFLPLAVVYVTVAAGQRRPTRSPRPRPGRRPEPASRPVVSVGCPA